MQRQSIVKSKQQGIIAISILILAAVFVTMAQGLLLIVHKECEAQLDSIRQTQILSLGESLICDAIASEEKGLFAGNVELPPVTLYPREEQVVPRIVVEDDAEVNLRQIKMSIIRKSQEWNIYQDKLSAPGGKEHPVYRSTIFAQNGFAGMIPAGLASADGASGTIMPQINVAGYKKYSNIVLPIATDLRDYGLGRRLYFNTASGNAAYSIAGNTVIKGDGVLVDESGITINSGCQTTGKIWLISGSGIIIGDNVKLGSALIIAQKNISIGNNVSINGIIISAGTITLGNDPVITRDEKVLEPFSTVCYFL